MGSIGAQIFFFHINVKSRVAKLSWLKGTGPCLYHPGPDPAHLTQHSRLYKAFTFKWKNTSIHPSSKLHLFHLFHQLLSLRFKKKNLNFKPDDAAVGGTPALFDQVERHRFASSHVSCEPID